MVARPVQGPLGCSAFPRLHFQEGGRLKGKAALPIGIDAWKTWRGRLRSSGVEVAWAKERRRAALQMRKSPGRMEHVAGHPEE